MNAAQSKYNAERLMTVLLAPVVSEKGTYIADKYEQVDLPRHAERDQARSQGGGRADVQGRRSKSVQIANVKGKEKRFGTLHRPAPQLEEGLRVPEAGPGNQLRGGGLNMALVKVKPTSAGPPRAGQGRQREPAQGRAGRVARREPEARLGPQQQRPHHDAPQGRRPQAALPDRRLQAQQGRHPGEGRAARIRPEPQRQHRAAAATPTASAATSSRRAASPSARS